MEGICKFDSHTRCHHTGQRQEDGTRTSLDTVAPDAATVMRTFAASTEIHEQLLQAHAAENPSCRTLLRSLGNGFCMACRKACEAAGVTNIQETKQPRGRWGSGG
ncbi:MAG: hypothetical protein WCS85_05605 [Candidatus Peribacteraceae bacterium]